VSNYLTGILPICERRHQRPPPFTSGTTPRIQWHFVRLLLHGRLQLRDGYRPRSSKVAPVSATRPGVQSGSLLFGNWHRSARGPAQRSLFKHDRQPLHRYPTPPPLTSPPRFAWFTNPSASSLLALDQNHQLVASTTIGEQPLDGSPRTPSLQGTRAGQKSSLPPLSGWKPSQRSCPPHSFAFDNTGTPIATSSIGPQLCEVKLHTVSTQGTQAGTVVASTTIGRLISRGPCEQYPCRQTRPVGVIASSTLGWNLLKGKSVIHLRLLTTTGTPIRDLFDLGVNLPDGYLAQLRNGRHQRLLPSPQDNSLAYKWHSFRLLLHGRASTT